MDIKIFNVIIILSAVVSALGVLMEFIYIKNTEIEDAKVYAYRDLAKACNKYGILVIIFIWLITKGEYDHLIMVSFTTLASLWFIAFISGLLNVFIRKNKDNGKSNIYMRAPKDYIVRCVVTLILCWIVI